MFYLFLFARFMLHKVTPIKIITILKNRLFLMLIKKKKNKVLAFCAFLGNITILVNLPPRAGDFLCLLLQGLESGKLR